ncbi:MAG: hypothetical protein ACPL7K_09625, partial [Armatimonadota bacterium]
VRYTDPSGHYSPEEIIKAFGVKTWDEVLSLFRSGGVLEGRWGWLEVLRRAQDGDFATGRFAGAILKDPDLRPDGRPSIGVPAEGGWFWRDEAGRIFVGNLTQVEFAAEHSEYALSTGGALFSVPASKIHYHPTLTWGAPDPSGALQDVLGILIDLVGVAALANIEATPANMGAATTIWGVGVTADWVPAALGLANIGSYRTTGRFSSGDVLAVLGVIPLVGGATDFVSLISNITGLRVDVTP